MTPRRLLLAAVCLIVGVTGAGATWAAFSSTTENTGNSLATSAATPAHARIATGTYTGNNTDNRNFAVAFQPHVVIIKGTNTQTGSVRTFTMSGDAAKPMAGATALTANIIQSLTSTGFQVGTNARVNATGVRYDWVAFESSQGAMQMGNYIGNGAARSFTGVGFSPEYVMVLPEGTGRAVSRASGQGTSFQFDADTGNAARVTSLDADGFSVGTSADVNTSGQNYHWIAWNRRGGLSEMTTYNGTGSAGLTAYTGFQPAYAITRRNDTTTASEAHQRIDSQAAGDSYPFAATGALTNSITAFNSLEVVFGTNAVANTNGATHSLVAFKSRPYPGGGGSSCATPGTQTVNANADGWVDQASPGSNAGGDSVLKVTSKTGNANTRAFVRFTLPATPAGCSVAFAKLRLYNKSPIAGRTLEAASVNAAWVESTINWTNQPAAAATSQTGVPPAAAGYMEWSVTNEVRGHYTTNNGFRISDTVESQDSTEQQFDSKESGANLPQLQVTFQ